MRLLQNVICSLTVAALVALPCLVLIADEEAAKQGKKGKNAAGPLKSVENKLEKLELTPEQREKVSGIVESFKKKYQEAHKSFEGKLTAEQQQAMQEARRQGKTEGKKGKELREVVQEAGDLSAEQKESRQAHHKQVQQLERDLRSALAEVLSPAQLEQAGLKTKGKKKAK